MNIIDLTITMDNDCLTCGTPWHQKVRIEQMGSLEEVGRNTHSILLGSHTGTHIDAPLHFYDNASGIDQVDLNSLIGDVTIVDFGTLGKGDYVTLEMLKYITVSERMLFKFGWCKNWKTTEYYNQYPYFTMEAIDYLINHGMKLMAMDTPSPDPNTAIKSQGDSLAHKKLLGHNVIIIEYLTNTDRIRENQEYNLIALPLKLRDLDGSPARVILVEKV